MLQLHVVFTYLKKRFNSFGFAFSGLMQALKSEPNLRIHTIIAIWVVAAGFFFSISKMEWLVVSTCIVLVISVELINSAIEKLCDLLMPERHPKIKYVKDVSAAAVLITCMFAFVAGIIVFWPYIKSLN